MITAHPGVERLALRPFRKVAMESMRVVPGRDVQAEWDTIPKRVERVTLGPGYMANPVSFGDNAPSGLPISHS